MDVQFGYDKPYRIKGGSRMHADTVPTAQFVHLHFVDEKYHGHHSQLLHKHDDVLELFYAMRA